MSDDLGARDFAQGSKANSHAPSVPAGSPELIGANLDEHSKIGGSIHLADFGNISQSIIPGGAALGENIFAFADKMGDTLAPLKFSTEAALAPLKTELDKAGLESVTPGKQFDAGITGRTGAIVNEGQGHGG